MALAVLILIVLSGYLLGIYLSRSRHKPRTDFYEFSMLYRQTLPTIEERTYCFQLLQWLADDPKGEPPEPGDIPPARAKAIRYEIAKLAFFAGWLSWLRASRPLVRVKRN
jgi:MNLL subunit